MIDSLGAMETALIDPRDIRWEVRQPTYRCYFWTVPDSASSEWRITGAADVHEAIAWAEAERGERTYELFIEYVESNERRGLIRLSGDDPTAGTLVGPTSISSA